MNSVGGLSPPTITRGGRAGTGGVRRIVSLRYANRKELPIVRRTRADVDKARLLAELATRPRPTDEEIEAQAIEDGDAWTDEELAGGEPVNPPPSPDQVRALRAKLGLTQAQFARRFGFTRDTVQQYEQGRRRPSGPASTLLRVIEADPEAVVRALRMCKTG
jgi:putative transcriptional regulator